MMVYVLLLVTSSYAKEVAIYPNAMICTQVLLQMTESLAKPPRAVLSNVMCVPTFVMPVSRPAPPAAMKPGPSA